MRWWSLIASMAAPVVLSACVAAGGPAVFSSPSPGAARVAGVADGKREPGAAPVAEALAPEGSNQGGTAGGGAGSKGMRSPGGETGIEAVAEARAGSVTRESGSEDDCATEEEAGARPQQPTIASFLGTDGYCLEDEVTPTPVSEGAAFESPNLAAAPGRVTELAMDEGLLFLSPKGVESFPEIYRSVDHLVPGACPERVEVRCEPISSVRREGPVWASARDRTIYVRTADPERCSVDGQEPLLWANLFKVCLGRMTTVEDRALSRHEKGLRFLEEGFAQYLLATPEAERFGGRPRAYRGFLAFVAQMELDAGFTFDSFWDRLATLEELADPAYVAAPRRIEAQFVAGAFVMDLVENQGLGVEGYLDLWSRMAKSGLEVGKDGVAIPREALEPVLNMFLAQVLGDGAFDIEESWSRFVQGIQGVSFRRPGVKIEQDGARIVLRFTDPMVPDRADIMLNGIQFGPERFSTGLAAWRNDRTVVIDVETAKARFGLERVDTVQVNGGRCWQWFLSEEGIPAEDTTFALPPSP